MRQDAGHEIRGQDLMEPGRIGIVSRSAPLAREVGRQLAKFELGASKVVVVPAQGVTCLGLLKMFEHDWGTDAVLLLGPIDAGEAEACAEWIAQHMDKPVIEFIDDADADPRQEARLRACGVHTSHDAAAIGALTASLVDYPWLPFD
jgi:succinyl-CoA synthetase alpha subunit